MRSLKLECEKLASEKTEMQRHYVMYYEMSYGLNIEMHKQRPQQAFVGVWRQQRRTNRTCLVNVGGGFQGECLC
uniref:Groucho/TLE N-terminal Q-rich domain-containing protein n=1 Tax=Knipowitschia caucasica TaxID=637954 RepID=A0AAV2MT93_KNICA